MQSDSLSVKTLQSYSSKLILFSSPLTQSISLFYQTLDQPARLPHISFTIRIGINFRKGKAGNSGVPYLDSDIALLLQSAALF